MRVIILFIGLLIILSGCIGGYKTLEEAVQSQWDTPIEVINKDEEKKLIYYLEQSQHVVGVYEFKNGKYIYNNEQSVGNTFSSEKGIPFYIRAKHFEGAGDIIFGAISTDEHIVEKFVIHYKNGETQEIAAENNTFLADFPSYLNISIIDYLGEIDNAYAYAYDLQGEVIESWR
jgi:hypothetical protein